MNEGKAALARIVGEIQGASAGPWEARVVPDEMPTSCCKYGVIALNGLEVLRLWKEEDARYLQKCDPDSLYSIAAYVAELEGEIVRLKCENYRDRAVAQIASGEAVENASLDSHLIDDVRRIERGKRDEI